MVSVYANKVGIFEGYDLVKRRVYIHISKQQVNSAEGPTTHGERIHEQHLKHAALATAIDNSAYICKPNAEPCEDYTG